MTILRFVSQAKKLTSEKYSLRNNRLVVSTVLVNLSDQTHPQSEIFKILSLCNAGRPRNWGDFVFASFLGIVKKKMFQARSFGNPALSTTSICRYYPTKEISIIVACLPNLPEHPRIFSFERCDKMSSSTIQFLLHQLDIL